MHGLHLTADLYRCQCPLALLTDEASLRALCLRLTEQAGLSVVGDRFFTFPARAAGQVAGVTGMVLLAESHLAVHTWPELGSATLDVYVCNYTQDNSAKAEALQESLLAALRPEEYQPGRLVRGLAVQAA